MKICTSCKRFLPISKFTLRSDNESLRSSCRDCNNSRALEKYHAGDKTKSRKSGYRYNLKINYNLSQNEYQEIFDKQQGQCPICGTPLLNRFTDQLGESSVVDHNHSTGQTREILCTHCNKGLGCFKDSVTSLHKAIKYLEKHNL